jgi:FkbM family methyltransferase
MKLARFLAHNLPCMGLLTGLLVRAGWYSRLRARIAHPQARPAVEAALAIGGETLAGRVLQEYLTLQSLRIGQYAIDGYIDVGANVGQNTLAAAAFFGSATPIHAVEPSRDCAPALRRIAKQFPQVTFHALGFGDRTGTLTFNRSTSSATSQASTFREFSDRYRAEAAWARSPVVREEVPVSTLADWLPRAFPQTPRNLMLHIDAEGFDYEVLLGAQPVLSTVAVVIVEVTFGLFEQQKGLEDIMALLAPRFVFQGGLGAAGLGSDGRPMYQDFLFVRRDLVGA